jgi:hypothetical protein
MAEGGPSPAKKLLENPSKSLISNRLSRVGLQWITVSWAAAIRKHLDRESETLAVSFLIRGQYKPLSQDVRDTFDTMS